MEYLGEEISAYGLDVTSLLAHRSHGEDYFVATTAEGVYHLTADSCRVRFII